MTDTDKAIIKSMAKNDMCVSEVARELNYQRGNIQYHLDKIKMQTGLDPMKFYDLNRLLTQFGAKRISKKILSSYFQSVNEGSKNFELRKDEDNIQPGDLLELKEWNGFEYTGNVATRYVKYVLRNVPEYGLMSGYCIIGW
ncbi:MAG: DUF3850 domain-containing protein [Lachnospiraceae bacterium]|nr:DUF3850 domain-containing protein [Lachnospiraceae bacterium]